MLRILALLFAFLALIGASSTVLAQSAAARLFVAESAGPERGACPNQGGILDSVSVPVNESIELSIVTPVPAGPGGASFQLSASSPSVVAVGDRNQSFLPVVTVPEGQTQSNPFTVFGRTVGATNISAVSLSPDFTGFTVPAGAWDVGPDGNRRFLDPNRFADAANCREGINSPNLSNDETVLANCGELARGVVADGASHLLMRTRSGLQGVACFEIIDAGGGDPGQITVPVKAAASVQGLFQASSYYRAPEAFEAETLRRPVEVEFTYTSTIGNGNTTRFRATLDVVRPPVVLVHGLWSSGGSWSSFWQRNTPDFTTEVGDYEPSNAQVFSNNAFRVQDFAAAAIESSREKGYATTRADLIGHSMGGLLGRLYAQSAANDRPDNLGQGDLRRVMSLATPHYGSSFANLVVALHNSDAPTTVETIDGLLGEDIRQGAICDLAENSPALAGLAGGTSLPAHAVVAVGGEAGTPQAPASYWGGLLGRANFESALTRRRCVQRNGRRCTQREFVFDQAIVDGYRFREANDVIVPASSARGGLAGAQAPEFDVLHFGVWVVVRGPTNSRPVRNHSLPLLDQAVSAAAWRSDWPGALSDSSGAPRSVPGAPGADNPAIYQAECGPQGPLLPAGLQTAPRRAGDAVRADPRIQILSPAPGTVIFWGQTIPVAVSLDENLDALDLGVLVPGIGLFEPEDEDSDEPLDGFEVDVPVGAGIAGPLRLIAFVETTEGERLQGAEVQVIVRPEDDPQALQLLPPALRLDLLDRTVGRVWVLGQYADDIELDISHPLLGTSFESLDPAIAEVDGHGRVTALAAGQAVIRARHGELESFSTVIVTETPGAPLPPEPVSDQLEVRGSGFRLNRNSGFFVQQLTVSNPGEVPVRGPFHLLFSELNPEISLVNRDAVSQHLQPPGEPFISLVTGADGVSLQPGESLTLTLEFLNPLRVPIRYVPVVYRSASGI